MKALDKNQDSEDTNASTTSRWENRCPSCFYNQDTKTEIVMAEKKDTDLTLTTNQPSVARNNKSIVVPQKLDPSNLTTSEELLERHSISPDQESYNLHPAIGTHSSHYCSTSAVLSGVPDFLSSGNHLLQAQSL